MKGWPKDESQTADFCDLIEPLHLLATNVLKSPEKDFEYDGIDIASREAATCASIQDYSKLSTREYDHERDRDDLMIFLSCAFRLGVEQGRRSQKGNR